MRDLGLQRKSMMRRPWLVLYLKNIYLFIFRERGREGEREGEKHQGVTDASMGCFSQAPNWPATQASALTGN